MTDNITTLGADERARKQIDDLIASMVGPVSTGAAVIIDGRAIPNLTMHDHGERVSFILDGRFGFEFPREWAHQAAAFAAQAMAIGAGYPWLGAASRDRPFAPQVACIGENR